MVSNLRVLKTKYLFRSLVSLFQPEAILDVGSLDGSDALHFEKLDPNAKVYAFEASPRNFETLSGNVTQSASRITCVNRAAGAIDGTTEFLVWDEPADGNEGANPGMHSTRQRADAIAGSQSKLIVPMCRLDSFARENALTGRVALWVDVEGASFDVLSGADGLKDQIAFVHVEVETEEIWQDQKTERDVLALAPTLGLVAIARGAHPVQRDLVLVQKCLLKSHKRLLLALCAACAVQGPLTAAACRGVGRLRGAG